MGKENKGLYKKYEVHRTDGSSAPSGKHEHCRYFVLDISHDEFARFAIEAYARECREKYPLLAKDLDHLFCTGSVFFDGHTHNY